MSTVAVSVEPVGLPLLAPGPRKCSVCDVVGEHKGELRCGHGFCTSCFARFIDGSVLELHRRLRCCICGIQTQLTDESRAEPIEKRFGRDLEPRLRRPVAISFMTSSSQYVITDVETRRICVFDDTGRSVRHFGHTYGHEMSPGVCVTRDQMIVVPCWKEGDVSLHYYTMQGDFRGFAHLDASTKVGGVAVDKNGDILVTDERQSCIYVINKSRAVCHTHHLPRQPDENHLPQPRAITTTPDGDILLTDVANHCVRVYNARGELQFRFGSHGVRPTQFDNPSGIAVDDRGRVIVADTDNHRVQVFTARGRFLSFLVRYELGADVYMAPIGVTVTPGDRAAVLLSGTRDAVVGEVRTYEVFDYMV